MDTGNTIAAYIRHQSDGEQSKDTQTEYFPTNLILTSPNEEYVDWTMAVQMTTLEMTTEGSAVGTWQWHWRLMTVSVYIVMQSLPECDDPRDSPTDCLRQ